MGPRQLIGWSVTSGGAVLWDTGGGRDALAGMLAVVMKQQGMRWELQELAAL